MIKRRYSIQRVSKPESPKRFLGHDDNGTLTWMAAFPLANHFPTRRAAESFIEHRLRNDMDDAKVVRHTVH